MDLESKIISHIKKNFSNEQEQNSSFELPEESTILDKINKLKGIPPEMLAVIFEVEESNVHDANWDFITRTLQEEIMVKYTPGIGLEDDTEHYDKQWFSKFKSTIDYDKYYSGRFSEVYKEKLGPQVHYTLRQDSESIMNLCGSPFRENVKHIRGLVFGFVQSGKTLNYASVANCAMGAGYNMIIVLAGATNILRDQTQKRLNHDLIGSSEGKIVGVGKYDNIGEKKPISLTAPNADFNTKLANAQLHGINLENTKVPVIAVIKKNVTPLKNLKTWLESQSGKGAQLKKSLLLIDDESDYASINTREEEDPTTINKGIRDILNSFDVSSYLAVTATPFANILIDHKGNDENYGSDLFPKSFIWALDKPDSYLGVKETIGDSFVNVYELDNFSNNTSIEEEIKFTLTAKKGDEFNELPIYAKHAICRFLYDSTCLRNERSKTDHLSMLFNISRFTKRHQEIGALIDEFIEDLLNIIRNSSLKKINHNWLLEIKKMAEDNLMSFGSISEFWDELLTTIQITKVFDIHQKTKTRLTYTEGEKRNSILVGGLSLSRGYTIEGLITSVFIRTTKTFDTLMQMGRWFGHKKHIQKYITVFSTPAIQNRFELIEESVVDLLNQIENMRQFNQSPKDFGLNIRRHPNVVIEKAVRDMKSRQGLDVTSRSKSKSAENVTLKLSLSDRNMETVRFNNDIDSAIWNHNLVISLFEEIHTSKNCQKYTPDTYPELFVDQNKNKVLGYLNVSNGLINNFIRKFKLPPQKIIDTNAKLPLRFLLDFLSKPQNKEIQWDISLVTGGENDIVQINNLNYNKIKRTMEATIDGVNFKIPKNQLSIPQHEYRFLEGHYKNKTNRSEGRRLRYNQKRNPLLLLYPIKPYAKEDEKLNIDIYKDNHLWGWSISMPRSSHDTEYISVLANSVFLEELEYEFSDELENEDN